MQTKQPSTPTTLLMEYGNFSCALTKTSHRPEYSLKGVVAGTLQVFVWEGAVLSAGLKALASEITNLAENIEILEKEW